ncbi:uncharacterized protein ACMZJ9_018923 [Mantella aurantiaca]
MKEEDTKNSNDLSTYSLFPRIKQPKKKWIVGVSLALLLVTITVVSALVAIYTTQKHTETMVMMSLTSEDGYNFQQTIFVNEQENVAVFFVLMNNSSSTILLDYKQGIIAIRTSSSTKCYLLRMFEVQTQAIPEIQAMIRNFQINNTPPSKQIVYNIAPIKVANRVNLGIKINILCCDVPIYWSEMVRLKFLNILSYANGARPGRCSMANMLQAQSQGSVFCGAVGHLKAILKRSNAAGSDHTTAKSNSGETDPALKLMMDESWILDSKLQAFLEWAKHKKIPQ